MIKENEIIVCVSGGFQVLHLGHIRLFREAKKLGTKLVVLLNNDNWLTLKKGIVKVNENARKEILESIKYIDEVIITSHKKNTDDMSVCDDLEELNPTIFANGGDRFSDNIPEYRLCKELDIEMIFNVGGDKIDSSTEQLSYIQFHKYFKHIDDTNSYQWKYNDCKILVDKINENDLYCITSIYYDEILEKNTVDKYVEISGVDHMMNYCIDEVEKQMEVYKK